MYNYLRKKVSRVSRFLFCSRIWHTDVARSTVARTCMSQVGLENSARFRSSRSKLRGGGVKIERPRARRENRGVALPVLNMLRDARSRDSRRASYFPIFFFLFFFSSSLFPVRTSTLRRASAYRKVSSRRAFFFFFNHLILY